MRTASGPILELGMGDSSTPALHALAEATGRLVCSYDHEPSWVDRFAGFRSPDHQIVQVASWDDCPIEKARWSVALVDHGPRERRVADIARLAERAEVLVLHDSEEPTYKYDQIFGDFAHRQDFKDLAPWTTLLSNYVDVSSWTIMADKLIPKKPSKVRTSVLIPCAGKHIALLPELVATLRAQTRSPDEIVIAASGCPLSSLPNVDAQVIHSPDRITAGANRNRAAAVASGDVLIYQDADDLPHPQRVEIIAGLFESYEIDHLLHYFYYLKDEASRFTLDDAAARSRYHAALMSEVGYKTGLVEYVANGNAAVTRAIARAVQWPEHPGIGEDQAFNRSVYARTKRTAVVPLPLLTYRHNLSSFR